MSKYAVAAYNEQKYIVVETEPVVISGPSQINSYTAQHAAAPLDIPTYVDGDDGCTHPSVLDLGLWNSYRYWMAFTPLNQVDGDTVENPSIVASNDRSTWVVPSGLTNPIHPKGVLSYQADPELFYENSTLYCVWRGRDIANDIVIMYMSSTDGVDWGETSIMDFGSVVEETSMISPSIIKTGAVYLMYGVDYTDEVTVEDREIVRYTSSSIAGPWTFSDTIVMDYSLTELPTRAGAGITAWYPWHLYIVYIGGVYLIVLYERASSLANQNLWFLRSTDGVNFTFSKYPIYHHNRLTYAAWDFDSYRSCIVPFYEDARYKFHLFYSGRAAADGWPIRIGYALLDIGDTYIDIDDDINAIGSSRAAQLVAGNAHTGTYIFADDFTRTLESVDGLGTASDETVYGTPATYWRVSGSYAYVRSNASAYAPLELGTDYDISFSVLSTNDKFVFQAKYIDDDNFISIYPNRKIYIRIGGANTTVLNVYKRFKSTDINEHRIIFSGNTLQYMVNGHIELEYEFTVSNFADQAEMDTFMNEETTRFSIGNTADRIYDVTAKSV